MLQVGSQSRAGKKAIVMPTEFGQINQLDINSKSCNLLKSSEQIKGFNGQQRDRQRERERDGHADNESRMRAMT